MSFYWPGIGNNDDEIGGAEMKMVAAEEQERIMREQEEVRAEAEACGCGELRMPELTDEQLKKLREEMERQPIHIEPDSPVRPIPCVRDEHGEIQNQTVKDLVSKIDSELTELKWELAAYPSNYVAFYYAESVRPVEWTRIADEAADTITAITTLCEAIGINVDARDEAQRRVNNKNRSRDRL